MSDWPTSRKNDAPRGGEGETGLEAMVSAPRPSDCPRSAPALRGRFFAWEEKGTHARSVDARWRRAITEPASAQSAARGGLKSAIPPPQCRLRGLFVELGSSGQRDADRRGRQRFFAAVLLRLAGDAPHGPGVLLGLAASRIQPQGRFALRDGGEPGSLRVACASPRTPCGSAQDALSLTNSAMASVWPVWGNMFIAPAPTQR